MEFQSHFHQDFIDRERLVPYEDFSACTIGDEEACHLEGEAENDICNDVDGDKCEQIENSVNEFEREGDTEQLRQNGRAKAIDAAILAAKAATQAAKAAAEAAALATAAAIACSKSQCSGNGKSAQYNAELRDEGGDAAQIAGLRPSQSPIAISVQRCPTWTSLEQLRFSGYTDNPNLATITNTGQTAYFTYPQGERPKLGGGPLLGDYVFEQLHFHWSVDDFTGCEHVLDGHGYACEAHFVHYNSKYGSLDAAVGHADGLAVVGFLLQSVDAPNPRFDHLIAALDRIKQPGQTVELTADGLAWLDQRELYGSYVTYKGSLTTPPYTECVTWIIYETPVHIGSEQLGVFRQLEGSDRQLIERNVRPTQRHPPGHSVIKVEQHAKSKM